MFDKVVDQVVVDLGLLFMFPIGECTNCPPKVFRPSLGLAKLTNHPESIHVFFFSQRSHGHPTRYGILAG
jgi:hypothetical protein